MLSLKIDGPWEPRDFIEILTSIEAFYYKVTLLSHRAPYRRFDYDYEILSKSFQLFGTPIDSLDAVNSKLTEYCRYSSGTREILHVRRLSYASPGSIDLLGVGKVFETIANSVARLKAYHDEVHLRSERDKQASIDTELKQVELEAARASLISIKLKNAREALQLSEEFPHDQAQLVPLLVRDQDALFEKIAEGKLISADTKKLD